VRTKEFGEVYKYGFTTDVEMEQFPPGLNEQVITAISEKKNEPQWLLTWRLKAYNRWLKMEEPKRWPNITYPTIDYQDIIYFSRPKKIIRRVWIRIFRNHVQMFFQITLYARMAS